MTTDTLGTALARDWILEVNKGTQQAPEWVQVKGLKSIMPIFEGSEQDDSDIDSEGFASAIITGLAHRIEGSLNRKGTTGSEYQEDPGQQVIRLRGQYETGADNFTWARIYRRDNLPDAVMSEYAVKWADQGGDANGFLNANVTFLGRGKPKQITKPLIPSTAQSFTVTIGGATAGTFTLTWAGKTTAAIAFDATSAAIKSALAALDDGYAASDFTVTGSTGGPFAVTVPGGVLTGDGTGLTGGAFAVAAA